jgi:hypothetical protein
LKVYPLDPVFSDPASIEDIAHALSMKCRFTGHCTHFYSVAQHSLLVADWIEEQGGSRADQLGGLMHDAGEAYLPDLMRPIKNYVWFSGDTFGPRTFREVEAGIINWICGCFNIDPEVVNGVLVKAGDNVLLHAERRDLMVRSETPWANEPDKLWERKIEPLSPFEAKQQFLSRFALLSIV